MDYISMHLQNKACGFLHDDRFSPVTVCEMAIINDGSTVTVASNSLQKCPTPYFPPTAFSSNSQQENRIDAVGCGVQSMIS